MTEQLPAEYVAPIGCKECRRPIIGGKGDWWHMAPGGGYGDMRGPDGHLAAPVLIDGSPS